MHDPTDILEAIEAEDRARELQAAATALFADDLVGVMREPAGRRFISSVLDMAGANAASFDPANPEPHVTAWREGRRSLGRELQQLLHTECPELFDAMLRERAEWLRKTKAEALL